MYVVENQKGREVYQGSLVGAKRYAYRLSQKTRSRYVVKDETGKIVTAFDATA